MKTNLNYCIVLSSEQLAYLAGSKYGIDRMKILHQLIEAAVLKENDYAIKGFSTTLQVGQAILSEVDLSCKLGYDKKTISRVLDKMNQLGIVASTQGNRTSVHTLKCILLLFVYTHSSWVNFSPYGYPNSPVESLVRRLPYHQIVRNHLLLFLAGLLVEHRKDCLFGCHPTSMPMNETYVSDAVFSFVGKMPIISDEG